MEVKTDKHEVPEFDFGVMPDKFWCGHYFFPGTKDVIPDGNDCCGTHFMKLPELDGVRHPFYDYQEDLLELVKKGELYFCILKSPKLGITEMVLRYIIHRACKDWENGQVAIIVGTHKKEAENCIKRIKDIMNNDCNPIPINEEQANTKSEVYIRNLQIVAHPAMNYNSIRGQPKMKAILVDESAFFGLIDDKPVLDAAEHYMTSTQAMIWLVSTAGIEPKGFMYRIVNADKSVYNRIRLTDPFKYGLKPHPESGTHIYKNIELVKGQDSYARNYLGEWGAEAGNIFDYELIKAITIPYTWYNPRQFRSVLAVDPAYGQDKHGSQFAILGMIQTNGINYVNDEFQQANMTHSKALITVQKYMSKGYKKLLIDSSNPGLIADFKTLYDVKPMNFNESVKNALRPTIDIDRPVYKEDLKMMNVTQRMVNDKTVRINKDKNKNLVEQLNAIKYNIKGLPDKKLVPFDLGDCFRMCCYELFEEPFETFTV